MDKKNKCDASSVREEGMVRHIEALIQPDTSASQLLSLIGLHSDLHPNTPITNADARSGCVLVGLHPCGDLAATVLRVFAESEEVVGVACVSCCYMKLTTSPALPPMRLGEEAEEGVRGYPMSQFLKGRGHSLSYEARELACHSIAAYVDRLTG